MDSGSLEGPLARFVSWPPERAIDAIVASLVGVTDLRRARSILAARVLEPRIYLDLSAGCTASDGTLDRALFDAVLRRTLIRAGRAELALFAHELGAHASAVARLIAMPGPWPNDPLADDARRAQRRALGSIDPLAPPPIRPVDAAASPIPARDVWVNDVRLRLIDAASPRPDGALPLLLIHGHSSSVEEHTVLLPGLLRGRRIIACDLPGSGWSEHPVRHYDLRYYEDVLLGLMDALGIQHFAVVGGSMGGNLALRLALRVPHRALRCVAWAPANWIDVSPAMGSVKLVDSTTVWPVLERQAECWYPEDDPYHDVKVSAALAARREVFSPGFLEAYRSIAAEQVLTTMKEHASQVLVPVKLLVGSDDTDLGMVDGVRELAKRIPGAKLIELPGKHAVAEKHSMRLVQEIHEHVGNGARFALG